MKKSHPRSKTTRTILGYFASFLCLLLTSFTSRGQENLPKKGPYIIAPNHIDDVDPVPLTAAIGKPITYLMAQDQVVLPWYKAWGPWSYGVLLVNRSKIQYSSMKKVQSQIKAGEVVCIFPEGTVKGEGLKEGKRGVAFFAKKNDIPIIPVGITGTRGIIEKIRKLKKQKVHVEIGRPIYPNQAREQKELTEKVMKEIKNLLPTDHH